MGEGRNDREEGEAVCAFVIEIMFEGFMVCVELLEMP